MKPWINKDGKFQTIEKEDLEKLTAQELGEYEAAKAEAKAEEMKNAFQTQIDELKEKAADKEVIEKLEAKMDAAVKEMTEFAVRVKALGETNTNLHAKEDAFKSDFEAKKEALDELKKDFKGTVTFEVKATQTYGDINQGSDFAQMDSRFTDIPVRRPFIQDLFSRINLTTEFFKFPEQDTAVRDAQNVASCTPVTTLTKETIIVNSIQTKVIKDIIDFCIDFVDDYPFMRSRIDKLLNESLQLKIEQQILLGTGLGEETFSIDSVASTFSAINPVCPFNDGINGLVQAATFTDLIEAMAAQIFELGQQGEFIADTALVNYCDWVKFIKLSKDLDNNYIHPNFITNAGLQLGSVRVMWSPIVPADSVFVFDSTKGEIVDRLGVTIDVAFQNKDNWEKELASIKGYTRLNFLVKTNHANAFMKSTTVNADIAAIAAP